MSAYTQSWKDQNGETRYATEILFQPKCRCWIHVRAFKSSYCEQPRLRRAIEPERYATEIVAKEMQMLDSRQRVMTKKAQGLRQPTALKKGDSENLPGNYAATLNTLRLCGA